MEKKVLIIHKASDATEKLSRTLKKAGWRVESTVSGIKGVGLAQTDPFSLILIGEEIPDMSPFVVIKNLTSAPSAQSFFMLFLVSESFFQKNQGQLEKWKKEVCGFIKYPTDEKILIELCEAAISVSDKPFCETYREYLHYFEKTEVTQKKSLKTETVVKPVEKKEDDEDKSVIKDIKKEMREQKKPKALATEDLKTLKDYVALKEKEIEAFELDLGRAKEQIKIAQKRADDMDHDYHHLKNKAQEFEKKCEGLTKENEELRLRREQEIESRDQENRAKADKIALLERKLELSEQKYEEVRERVKKDIQKIRVQEKELEARLEILKRDSETLLGAKDRKLLEFRRRIDALEYELESLSEKEKEAQEKVHFFKQRMDRVLRALKMGTSLLEGETALELDLEEGESPPKKTTKAA